MRTVGRIGLGTVMVISAMAGPVRAGSDAEGPPTVIKAKFALPVNPDDVKQDWAARGYATPTVRYYARGWSKAAHTHPVHIILTVVAGRMEFVIAGERFAIEPGDELRYPAGAVHSARNLHEGASHMLESSKR